MNQLKKLKICLCTHLEAKYLFDETEGEMRINPYEHVQPEGENTAYILLEPLKQYINMADLKNDMNLREALAEIISDVIKVDENRKAYRELLAMDKQQRDVIIQRDLDDPNLEKLKEVRMRLSGISDIPKRVLANHPPGQGDRRRYLRNKP